MTGFHHPLLSREERWVLIVTFLILMLLANRKVYENDLSRFTAIECLVEKHTFCIDETSQGLPKFDKITIKGKYYSDKPPLLAVVATVPYYLLTKMGVTFKAHAPWVYFFLTLCLIATTTSALMLLFYRKLQDSGLDRNRVILMCAILLFATPVISYSKALNSHIIAAMLIFASFFCIARGKENRGIYLLCGGLCIGLVWGLDLPSGPIFTVLYFVMVLMRHRNLKDSAIFSLGALIPIVIYFLLNIHCFGDLKPAIMHPEYWNIDASEQKKFFIIRVVPSIQTGILDRIVYAFNSLFGIQGLLSNTPILFFGFWMIGETLWKAARRIGPGPGRFSLKNISAALGTDLEDCILGSGCLLLLLALFLFTTGFVYGGSCYSYRYAVAITPVLVYFASHFFRKERPGWQYTAFAIATVFSFSETLMNLRFEASPWVLYTAVQFQDIMVLSTILSVCIFMTPLWKILTSFISGQKVDITILKMDEKWVYVATLLILLVFTNKKPYENDLSRVDTIECLVEKRTFCIDEASQGLPKFDKITIGGLHYSDKPPLLAIAGAIPYLVISRLGITFRGNAPLAYYLLTLSLIGTTTSALMLLFYRKLQESGLDRTRAMVMTGILLLATPILSYSKALNAHTVAAMLIFASFCFLTGQKEKRHNSLFYGGLCIGAVWGLDLPSGPIFTMLFFILVLVRHNNLKDIAFFLAGVLIPVTIYFLLNIHLFGDFRPAIMHPEYWNIDEAEQKKFFIIKVVPSIQTSAGDRLIYAFNSFFGIQGLLSNTPILLLGFWMIGDMFWNTLKRAATGPGRFSLKSISAALYADLEDSILGSGCLLLFLSLILFSTGFVYGGSCYSYRYAVAIIPLLVYLGSRFFRTKRPEWHYIIFVIATLFSFVATLLNARFPDSPWMSYTARQFQGITVFSAIFSVYICITPLLKKLLSFVMDRGRENAGEPDSSPPEATGC